MMWFSTPRVSVLALVSVCSRVAMGIDLDLTSQDSIKSVASTIAYDMMTTYRGNYSGQIPGLLPGPPPNPTITNAGYFWWEAGGMFGTMIDYWHLTGDSTYNDVVSQGMLFQTGTGNDYLPQNQTNGMGNDDQGFWGISAMQAAEQNFPNPPANQPQWLSLAIAVHNTQWVRFDNVCGGGLRWQAYSVLTGFNYKNSIANGCFFNIAARLARYTGNTTYADRATSTWDWLTTIGLIDDTYNVFDGTSIDQNCTIINKQQFSYNAGIYILGAATMYNFTTGDTQAQWKTRTERLLNQTISVFFPNNTAFEVTCEATLVHCTIDMLSLKTYLVRWIASATKVAPFLLDQVTPLLQTSAKQAALQCSGGTNGRMCGLSWYKGSEWDGTSGVGQQMAALGAVMSNLIETGAAPLTNSTGGTSVGDPTAGTSDGSGTDPTNVLPPTGGAKAGAGILTAVVVIGVVGSLVWLSLGDGPKR